MFLKASGENFLSITGMHTHFRSVLFINIAYSGGVNACWNLFEFEEVPDTEQTNDSV